MIGIAPSKIRTREADEHEYIVRILRAVGVDEGDARDVADVLVAADVRGIESHGIARLEHFYVTRLERGVIAARPAAGVVRETPTTLNVDAGNGLGHPAAKRAMTRTIEKAREHGVCITTVGRSNHFGIAGYYAMMALEHGMIGLASTNGSRLVVATFGAEKVGGTNPIAVAIPAGEEPPFVLDMATSAVTYGRLEVSRRKGLSLGEGWAVDASGAQTVDPGAAMRGGALLPLGGLGTGNGGHKGYGLVVLVELLCALLSGSAFGAALAPEEDARNGGVTSHFFAALRIDALRDPAQFARDLDRELRTFRGSRPVPGEERVLVPGDPEAASTERYRREGVPIDEKVWEGLDRLSERLGIPKLERFTVA